MAVNISNNLQVSVDEQFGALRDSGVIYLNSGCCGRKPPVVLEAISRAQQRLNLNPCHNTFNDDSNVEQARDAVATLLKVDRGNVLLGSSTTALLQIIMQSFLQKAGDELITTDQEHGSLRTIARYLGESRGVICREFKIDTLVDAASSERLTEGILHLVTPETRLVALSALVSYTGWRPDLSRLALELERRGVLLLADCAHGPGHIDCRASEFPLWVGSGHKWLGGPNGTAFAYIRSDLRDRLQPVALGDTYYERRGQIGHELSFLEGIGTADTTKFCGLTAAIDWHQRIKDGALVYQGELAKYLRGRLEKELQPEFRVADLSAQLPQECTSIVNFRFAPQRLRVANLQEYLWQEEKIAVQLDYLGARPEVGMRVSCHISNTQAEVDRLIEALSKVVIK